MGKKKILVGMLSRSSLAVFMVYSFGFLMRHLYPSCLLSCHLEEESDNDISMSLLSLVNNAHSDHQIIIRLIESRIIFFLYFYFIEINQKKNSQPSEKLIHNNFVAIC